LLKSKWWVAVAIGMASALCYINGWPIKAIPSSQMLGGNFAVVSWAWLAGFTFYCNRTKLWAMILAFAPCVVLHETGIGHNNNGFEMCAVFSVLLVASPYLRSLPKPLIEASSLAGDISYPLYVVHTPVNWLLFFLIGLPGAWWSVAASIFAAAVVYYAVDRPSRKMARRFLQGQTPLRRQVRLNIPLVSGSESAIENQRLANIKN